MITLQTETSPGRLHAFKERYVAQATAPLDGMWLTGFVPMADHYGFFAEGACIGYCCIDADGDILQFYLTDEHQGEARTLFADLVQGRLPVHRNVRGAVCSSAEPRMLSLCADLFGRIDVNALMYEWSEAAALPVGKDDRARLVLVDRDQLARAIEFDAEHAGGSEAWLSGYLGNLVARGELFAYVVGDRWLATGECRGYDEFQTTFADLGIIVAGEHRGRGIATRVLGLLAQTARARDLIPICSTEARNLAAQRAIDKAGFDATNRIIRFSEPAG